MRLFLLFFLLTLVTTISILGQSRDSTRMRTISSLPARKSTDWVRCGIIYEIYPRAFSPEGTFAGIEKKLPELQRLGVSILWLMPIHPVGELHRKGKLGSSYSVRDYYGVNPEYGTLDDFKHLLLRAHEMGFHLIIDLVANHTAWDSKLITEHPEWFSKDSTGKIVSPNPDWTDVADLDYSQPGLRRYMIDMMKYWVKDVGIDGFRCDVSELVPLDFWEEARAALDSIKPILMLSEGSLPDQHVKAFDITYSWNLYHAFAPLLSGNVSAEILDRLLAREAITFPKHSLRLRFSSNHDETAWDNPDVVKFGPDGARLAAVVTNTLPGVPLVYNGQEAGNTKKLGLFDREPIDWSAGADVRQFYTTLLHVRREHRALCEGTMVRIPSSDDRHVYAFLRATGNDTLLVVYNFASVPLKTTLTLSTPEYRAGSSLTMTDLFTGTTSVTALPPAETMSFDIGPRGYRIWSIK